MNRLKISQNLILPFLPMVVFLISPLAAITHTKSDIWFAGVFTILIMLSCYIILFKKTTDGRTAGVFALCISLYYLSNTIIHILNR